MNDSYIAQDHLLALFEDPGVKVTIEQENLIEANLKAAVSQFRGNRRTDSANPDRDFGSQSSSSALSKYTVDLTPLAADEKIDPVICREGRIRQIVRILRRRSNNNLILVGEPGVGKTAVIQVCSFVFS